MVKPRTALAALTICSLLILLAGCGGQAPAQVAVGATPSAPDIPAAILTGVVPEAQPTDGSHYRLPRSEPTLTADAEAMLTYVAIPSPTPTDTPIPYIVDAGQTLTITNGIIGIDDGHQHILVTTVGSAFRLVVGGWYYSWSDNKSILKNDTAKYVPADCVVSDGMPSGTPACELSTFYYQALKQGQTKIHLDRSIGCADGPCPTLIPGIPGMVFDVVVR